MIIFPDQNVSPTFFEKNAPQGKLLVRTMFATLQGEGPIAGRSSIFLRLGGCNLGAKQVTAHGCAFCDTDFRISESSWMGWSEIRERALDLVSKYQQPDEGWWFVITGGEPLLQPNLTTIIENMLRDEWNVQIETNGMYYLPIPDNAMVVMSPKAGPVDYPKPNIRSLERADYLKFLLEEDPRSPYHSVPDWGLTSGKIVYVSPIAVYKRPMTNEEGERADGWDDSLLDRETTKRNYSYAATYALCEGLRLSIQTHLFAAIP